MEPRFPTKETLTILDAAIERVALPIWSNERDDKKINLKIYQLIITCVKATIYLDAENIIEEMIDALENSGREGLISMALMLGEALSQREN